MFFMINVKIILINSEKEILLLHRENKQGIDVPNKWSFVGGALDDEETPEESIIRETKEEIEYNIKNITLFNVYNDPGIQRYIFVGTINKNIPELTLTEGDDMNFFTVEEALKMDISKNTKRYIEDYFINK